MTKVEWPFNLRHSSFVFYRFLHAEATVRAPHVKCVSYADIVECSIVSGFDVDTDRLRAAFYTGAAALGFAA